MTTKKLFLGSETGLRPKTAFRYFTLIWKVTLGQKLSELAEKLTTSRCTIIHWLFWYQDWSFSSKLRPLKALPLFAWAPLNIIFYASTWPYASYFTIKRQHCRARSWHIQNFSVLKLKNSFCEINQSLLLTFNVFLWYF